MTILIVEDDAGISEFVAKGLRTAGHQVDTADRGDSGLQLAQTNTYEALILDVTLPGMSGRDICRILREQGSRVPIMMLSALDSSQDIVRGLRFGADDYVTKPFAFDEFIARVDALIRRGSGEPLCEQQSVLAVGNLVFDRDALIVERGGRTIELTSTEYALLELLMLHAGRIVTKARILENVWGLSKDPLTNVVEVYIGRLRNKTTEESEADLIRTVRGRGYRMTAPD